MKPEDFARLGESSLRIGGLRIWVHGRQFPQSEDYWDGNWLMVTASFRSAGSWVCASGPLIHGSEVAQFLAEAECLHSSIEGIAALACMEPHLRVEMKGNGRGQIELEVWITPDQLTESHTYREELDQTYLPSPAHCLSYHFVRIPYKRRADRH